jgi:hypothetical protein
MNMAKTKFLLAIALAGILSHGTAMAEESAGVQHAKEFWAAVANGDPATMKDFYAKEVTLRPGSELLKEQWGIRGAGDRNKALLVSRDDLITAYQRMIDKVGREKWKKIFSSVPPEQVVVTSLVTTAQSLALNTIADDIVLKVQPGKKDDTFFYVFRRMKTGNWQVVAELADY